MKTPNHSKKKMYLLDKLEETRTRFVDLLEEIPDNELDKKWTGEGWTIKEELVHIVQVVGVIPAGIERASKGKRRSTLGFIPAGLRGWVNGQLIIPRRARNQTRETIKESYREAHEILVSTLAKLQESDWEKGMPYPRKFRTIEQMAYRPVEHFEAHEAHIRQLLETGSRLAKTNFR